MLRDRGRNEPSRLTIAEELAQRLEKDIIAESLAPGARLGTKDELRQRFGVALATLNEAVRLMERRGVVAARPGPGGGLFVGNLTARSRLSQLTLGADLSSATLGECVEFRNDLEGIVCEYAARAPRKAAIEQLFAIVDEMSTTLDDAREYLRVNWKFHRQVGRMTQNAVLEGVYLTIIDVIAEELDDFHFAGPKPADIEVHRNLAEKIAAGPGQALTRAVKRHREHSPLPNR